MTLPLLPSLVFFFSIPFLSSAKDERALQFAENCAMRLSDTLAVQGDASSWFFPTREIRQLSLGNFWEKSWSEVSQNQSDPIPSMVEFHKLLKAKGVKLLIVPIPAKAAIYPEKFSGDFEPGDAPSLTPFVKKLRSKGLKVIDLEPYLLEARERDSDEKYYCAQDAHFSPMACVKIASVIGDSLEKDFRIKRIKNPDLYRSETKEIEIVGDLVAYSDWAESSGKESLKVQFVKNPMTLRSDIDSPILLLGDSHTLVFSDERDFHCDGAGLFDHLSVEMGRAIDLEGSAGGGLVSSRINLFRKAVANPNYWEKKKVVVWVFTAREFTQNSDKRGFISIPIEREK